MYDCLLWRGFVEYAAGWYGTLMKCGNTSEKAGFKFPDYKQCRNIQRLILKS